MRIGRIIYFYLAAASLTTGSAIYLLFRPTSLLMFHWADSIRLMGFLEALRSIPFIAARPLFPWVIYSLPFALWVFSYVLCMEIIWWRSSSQWRNLWIWFIPIVSLAFELCQLLGVLEGTFDPVDLVAIGIATACGLAVHAIE